MQPFTDPHLFNAHALAVDNTEPHAQLGNHLRVNTHPMLGLPVAPFVVSRSVIDNPKLLNVRNTAVFIDQLGNVLQPPFQVTPENSVTAYLQLAPNEVCLWAEAYATPDDVIDSSSTALVCEAFVTSAVGPASIGRRSKPRYAFAAPGLVEIRITGSGQVTGVSWIEAEDPQHLLGEFVPFAIMNLPHVGGARYITVQNTLALANSRVDVQAPKRQPLQETVNAPAPMAAPIANVAFERDRVKSLTTGLSADLDRLINDLTQTPFEQIIKEKIFNEQGRDVGVSTMSRLNSVFQQQNDHGTASLLGYKMLDTDWRETENRLVFYQIDGFFRNFPSTKKPEERTASELLFAAHLARLQTAQRNLNKEQLYGYLMSVFSQLQYTLSDASFNNFENQNDYISIGTIAIADRGAPLDQVLPPQITDARHIGWLPETPPAARREIEMSVSGVRIGGLLAAGKRTPATGSGSYDPLNKPNPQGFHLPLALSLMVDQETALPITEAGTGFIADRQAKEPEIRYFIAQQDRFGRWSDWAARNAPVGPRPKPPRPEFQGFYTQPSLTDAATTGGAILVKVIVPDAAALAPGSYLLDKVRLFARDERFATVSTYEATEASKTLIPQDPNNFVVQIRFMGPVLQSTEIRKLRLTAKWIDVVGTMSDESEPQFLNMTDPLPPAQITVPDQLQYAARPDITGISWVEYRWTPQPNQSNFGIYYTDENRLRAHLESISQTAILTALNTAGRDAAARATIYRTNLALFPDHLFERLQDVNVNFNSGEQGFRHGVSGSLRLLNFYKIAAEAATGARPVLINLPLIVYGIPNADPPAVPTVQVEPTAPLSGEPSYVVKVTIHLLVGTTVGQNWRLRRTAVGTNDPNKMPVVTTGVFGAVDTSTGIQSAITRDTGALQIATTARLKPWVRYNWIAEAQGVPESGSTASGTPVAGLWSRASDPVSLVLVPAQAPSPVTIDSITGTSVAGGRTSVTLQLSHSDVLEGGEMGSYRVRVLRRLDTSSALEILHEANIFGISPFSVPGVKVAAEVVPIGAKYLVELIDPLGRISGQTAVTLS